MFIFRLDLRSRNLGSACHYTRTKHFLIFLGLICVVVAWTARHNLENTLL